MGRRDQRVDSEGGVAVGVRIQIVLRYDERRRVSGIYLST